MPMWPLLLLLIHLANADLTNVVVVQNFNLKSDVASNVTCGCLKAILVENVPVAKFNCIGETTAKATDPGMWIVVESQPVAVSKKKQISWLIECNAENMTSSISVDGKLDVPLSASSTVIVKTAAKAPTTEASSTTTKATEKPTTKPTPKPTETSVNVTVTVGYIQFQTGQAPVDNKNTQAVVVAVIEGLLLGAILFVFLFKCYRQQKLRATGMYPPPSNFSNPPRSSVYYDNGGTLSYGAGPNARPEIPSYRTPDTQPAVRLDSLSPRPQQQVVTPNLMTVSSPTPNIPPRVSPAPLNYWPDQSQPQPVKNIMDSDM
ncbi:hypothetical protein Q1695_015512 [Nippostrongylus brasiliensis]|nr:hypothetical protein Q1695_015512 [Nippostrongylus brasiliensis]